MFLGIVFIIYCIISLIIWIYEFKVKLNKTTGEIREDVDHIRDMEMVNRRVMGKIESAELDRYFLLKKEIKEIKDKLNDTK